MIREGQAIGDWVIVDIDFPVGDERWIHPPEWVMASLMDPTDELVILNLPPKDQTPERIRVLLREELATRSKWLDKEIAL